MSSNNSPTIKDSGVYSYEWNKNRTYCLDFNCNNKDSPMMLSACNMSTRTSHDQNIKRSSQEIQYTINQDNVLNLFYGPDGKLNNKCIGVVSDAENTALKILDCGTPNIKKDFLFANNKLKLKDTDKCITVKDGVAKNKTPIILTSCSDNNQNQEFTTQTVEIYDDINFKGNKYVFNKFGKYVLGKDKDINGKEIPESASIKSLKLPKKGISLILYSGINFDGTIIPYSTSATYLSDSKMKINSFEIKKKFRDTNPRCIDETTIMAPLIDVPKWNPDVRSYRAEKSFNSRCLGFTSDQISKDGNKNIMKIQNCKSKKNTNQKLYYDASINKLKLNSASGNCVGVDSDIKGTYAELVECNNTKYKTDFVLNDPAYPKNIKLKDTNKCLEVENKKYRINTNIYLSDCDNSSKSNQYFVPQLVLLYENPNYQGRSVSLADLGNYNVYSDDAKANGKSRLIGIPKINSIKIPFGLKLTAYKKIDQTGDVSVVFSKNNKSLDSVWGGGVIKSFTLLHI
jgi:hypothetical protein